MQELHTEVLIVGAGPAGLMLAIELGCRGIPCVIFDREAQAPRYPKANASSARTMEHYRRRGLAELVRAAGLPQDHAQDIVYLTRLTGYELTRFRGPSAAQARARAATGDFRADSWPSPELPHRGQQMYIEAILRDALREYPSVTTCYGHDVTALDETPQAVSLTAGALRAHGRYVVGCDGARSLVRNAMQTVYAGQGAEQRAFFGGQMASIYIKSAALAALLPAEKAWQYWFVNGQRRGVMVAINGVDEFVFGVQLAPGQAVEELPVGEILATLAGRQFDYTLLHLNAWTAGHTLVAERFRAGRCFIAGDAAHLFTPTSGMGYNTSVDDAVNLGWKLAAVLQGWGGEALLDSYERERQPIARRNTSYARAMADSMAALAPPERIEDAGLVEDGLRHAFGERCRMHLAREYNIPGLQLGLRYESEVLAHEDAAAPVDDPTEYLASAYPGARAPHVELGQGEGAATLFDHFGRDFTLLCLEEGQPDAMASWRDAALAACVPLSVLRCDVPQARKLYGAALVLVRPDGHVAWRGDAGADAAAVLQRATGQALPVATLFTEREPA